jgi:hypothetical protein
MKQLQFYKWALLFMMILNIGLISFFIITKPKHPEFPPPPPKDFRPIAIEILELDSNQQSLFLVLAKQHNQQMETVRYKQKNALKLYFNSLLENNNKNNEDSILNEIQVFEKQKIILTFQHFEQIKLLLTKEQQVNYKEFVNKTLGFLIYDEKKHHPKRRNL